MNKKTMAYISDTRYYVDSKGNWYTSLIFPIEEIESQMEFVSKWIFFGRLYRSDNISNMYKIPLDKLNIEIEFRGSWEQKKGIINHLKNAYKNTKLIRQVVKKSDVIWLKFSFVASYLATLFCSFKGKIIISHLVGDIDCNADIQSNIGYKVIRKTQKLIMSMCNKKANLQVFVSNNLAQKYAIKHKPYYVINENRINKKIIDEYRNLSFKNDDNTYKKEFNMIFVGRLATEKGIFDLLEAMKKIDENINLTIVGEGELREEIEVYIKLNHLSKRVILIGKVAWGKKLFDIIHKHQILVLPSYSEGLGLVLLESMSVGVPVVASNVGGIPEIVKHQENGLLFNPRDTQSMKERIMELYENQEKLISMKNKCFDTADKHILENKIQMLANLIREEIN